MTGVKPIEILQQISVSFVTKKMLTYLIVLFITKISKNALFRVPSKVKKFHFLGTCTRGHSGGFSWGFGKLKPSPWESL